MEKGGLIVVEGTLPSWVTIVMVGFVFAGLMGYFNHYVPKEQQKKAEHIERDFYNNGDYFVRYSTRISQMWYLISATIFSVVALICFIIQDFELLHAATKSFGFMSWVIDVLALIVLFFVIDVFLVTVSCAGETAAIKDTRQYYWRRYGAITISEDESL